MQRRNAALNYYYFILLLIGVLLSTVSRRLEPLCAVLPLAVALLYSRVVRTTPVFTVHCQVTPQRVFEGDPITVEMTIKAETAMPPTELWHVLPREATCVAGNNRVVCTLRPGEVRTLQHTVVFAQRGKYTLGRLYGRVHPATDLQPWLFESPRSRSVAYTRTSSRCRGICRRCIPMPPLAIMSPPAPVRAWSLPGYANIAVAIGSGVCTGVPPWPGNSST